MCTAVVSVDPESPAPVLLAGVRDEFADRAWEPPGPFWPGLIGGRDLLAGGTWLAVNPAVPRVATVLNGIGPLAPAAVRLTRGGLPTHAAAHGTLDGLDVRVFDPFELICAGPAAVRLWSWDGADLVERRLGPGLHLVVNSGLEGRDRSVPDHGTAEMAARVAHFRPLLEAAKRPEPGPSGTPAEAWGEWLPLVDGAGLPVEDPRALVLRRMLGGRPWGTGSISLVALGPSGVRYDFSGSPGDPAAWRRIA